MPNRTRNVKVTDRKKAWNIKKAKKHPYKTEIEEKEKTFLIICEGENTEPAYFRAFPVKTAQVKSYGLGRSKTALVEYVMVIIEDDNDKDTENWVVFDMDVKPDNAIAQKEDYENAIRLAESKSINVAFSNDAFELWFLLHYQYLDNQWTRHQYYKRLSELWNCNYERLGKQKAFCQQIYKRLQEDERSSQTEAIARAKKLLAEQETVRLSEKNPATRVYALVEALNGHI